MTTVPPRPLEGLKVVDIATDPSLLAIGYTAGFYTDVAIGTVGGLQNVQLLDDLEAGSVDFYGRLRSTYLQKRAAELGEAVGGVNVVPASLAAPTGVTPH